MNVRRAPEPEIVMDAEERFEGFENLMPFKVHNILLVSSFYDSFILREDGRLNELLIDQSLDLTPQTHSRNHARIVLRRGGGTGPLKPRNST
jgi:hypothetical protein